MFDDFIACEKWTQADTLSGLRFREEDHICTCNGASSSSFSSFLDRRQSHLIPAAPQYNSLWASKKKKGRRNVSFLLFLSFFFSLLVPFCQTIGRA